MPSPEEILRQLTWLANDARWLAVAWHVAVLLVLLALWTRWWRPAAGLAAMFASLPLATATALAWSAHNPFNGLLLGVAAAALLVLGARLPAQPLTRGPGWTTAVGAAAVLYALVYPHFVSLEHWYSLAFAPVGIVPCPSLALVLGLGLLADGFGSRAWSLTAAAFGLLYAVIGIARLGVWLDVGLLAAALASLARGLHYGEPLSGPASHSP